MKNNIEIINSSKNQSDKSELTVENSSKFMISDNSTIEISKFSLQNFIQHNSQVLPKPIYNLNLSNEESDILSNRNQNNNLQFLSYYSPLTSIILPKELIIFSKKNFPSKEQLCKGVDNFNLINNIPNSNTITQYFNLDNIFKSDIELQLGNKYNGETHISKISDTSKSVNYNCPFSDLFNEIINNDLRNKKFIVKKENYENNHKNKKENDDELSTDNIKHINQNNNFIEEKNDILTKIKCIKKKKFWGKPISNNDNKQSNSLSKNINNNHIIDNNHDNSSDIGNKEETEEIQKKDSLNILYNLIEEKNNNKHIIKEEQNSYLAYNNNLNIYLDKNEKNNKQNIIQNEEEIMEDVYTNNVKENKIILNDETNDLHYNKKLNNNNMNNYIEINNKNLKYINNIKINCINLNIYNNLNIKQNLKNKNMDYPNKQQLYYLKKNNNGQIKFENNRYNKCNSFKSIDKNNFFHMNLNTNFSKNNINKNNSFFNNINNDIIINDINKKKKKYKKIDDSFYIGKPLNFIGENLYRLGKDQDACRYIQKLLDANPQETLNHLYKYLCANIFPLINYPFGNYLIQKIIKYLNQEQLYEILNIISFYFLEICNNIYGTRVIQTIIDNLKTPKVINYFYQLLKPKIIELFKVLNGTFVVHKFLQMFPNYTNEINDIIVEGSFILSTHRHGYFAIQKYLMLNDHYLVPKLINKLIDNSLQLIDDQYGNYVIQSILHKNNKNYANKIAEKIVENVVYYANNKYSSNVVRKLFDYCNGIYLLNLMNNVQKNENLVELILNEHGNYVVQKVLKLSNPIMQRQILKIIKINFNKLKNCSHGERLIYKLHNNYPIINNKNFIDEI